MIQAVVRQGGGRPSYRAYSGAPNAAVRRARAANRTVRPKSARLAAAAAAADSDDRVEEVVICTPDKDLSQCVRGTRVVQLNRRTRVIRDEAGVVEKFGVPPASIPDYLALVGDAADGYPGLPGWGAKSAAGVLARYGHLESIPADWRTWHVNAANPRALAEALAR